MPFLFLLPPLLMTSSGVLPFLLPLLLVPASHSVPFLLTFSFPVVLFLPPFLASSSSSSLLTSSSSSSLLLPLRHLLFSLLFVIFSSHFFFFSFSSHFFSAIFPNFLFPLLPSSSSTYPLLHLLFPPGPSTIARLLQRLHQSQSQMLSSLRQVPVTITTTLSSESPPPPTPWHHLCRIIGRAVAAHAILSRFFRFICTRHLKGNRWPRRDTRISRLGCT